MAGVVTGPEVDPVGRMSRYQGRGTEKVSSQRPIHIVDCV